MRRARAMMAEINITSLTDVSLTLLIIFIVSAPLLKAGMDVSLPKTSAAKITEKESIMVTINKNKEIFIDDKKVSLADFGDKFKSFMSSQPGKAVYLKSDKEVPYGTVIDIVGKIKLAGVENLGLAAELERTRSAK
ncbi:MAG: biopolymer transporter ExbD [bacterium]|nr:biopolymer transporter ExbD [bacterium]